MLLLKKNTFELASEGARVTADEAAAVVRAEEVIAAAEAEAEAIRAAARDAAEAEKKRGYAEGLDEGKTEILMQ